MTALRMVQRMKRDWMHTGRRPSGLCGAALLVASRLHDFNRSIRDLVRIVKVCETTIRKRLTEFGETPSSKLTLDEFMSIDLEEEQDPPCFKAARKKQKQSLEEQGRIEKVSEEISKLQKKIEAELEERRRKVRNRFASSIQEDDRLSEEEENRISSEFIMGNTMETINACLDDTRQSNEGSAASGSAAEDSVTDRLALRGDEDGSDEEEVECLDVDKPKQSSGIVSSLRPTAATLGLKESIEECMRVRDAIETTAETGVLDLEGLDDEELDSYIMTDAEVRLKTKFWLQTHAEYLKEMEEKEARKALEAEENANKPEAKKRKRRKRAPIQANTAGEAIEKMLQEKKISNKINYDVLKSLNSELGFPSSEPQQESSEQQQPQPSASEADKSETQSVVSEPPKKKSRGLPPIPASAFSSLMSTVKSIALSQQKAKSDVISDDEDDIVSPAAKPAAADDRAAMKELEEEIEYQEEDEEEEEEDDPDDEFHLGAGQLLNKLRGEEQDEFSYHEEYDDYGD